MRKKVSLKLMLAFMCLLLMTVVGLIPDTFKQWVDLLEPALFLSLLCGILTGWFPGALAGALAPLCIHFLTGDGLLIPDTTILMIVYGVSGLFAGAMYKVLHNAFAAAVSGLFAGRIAMGIAGLCFSFTEGRTYTLTRFLKEGFGTPWAGLIACMILLPFLILLFRKAGVMQVLYPGFDYNR